MLKNNKQYSMFSSTLNDKNLLTSSNKVYNSNAYNLTDFHGNTPSTTKNKQNKFKDLNGDLIISYKSK